MEFSLATQSHVSDYVDENMMGSVAERNDVVSVEEYLADDYFLDVETYDKENETLEGGGGGGDESKPPSVFSFEAPPLSELALPAHDEAELEWVSMIMDDSLSEIPKAYGNHQIPAKNFKIDEAPNPTQPPPPMFAPMKAKRSKRSRTLSAASWSSSSSSSSSTTTTASSVPSSSFSSPQLILAHHLFDEIPHPISRPPPPPPSKKRGRKPKAAVTKSQTSQLVPSHGRGGGGGERRCSHCGVSRTPQWRAGPHGARTLCNACGVRYKSGRLLPEYRPACSPTFVSHVHSNSHRKVLEMRRKKEERREGDKLLLVCSAPPVASF